MREKSTTSGSLQSGSKVSIGADDSAAEEYYDEKTFFESFYRSTVRGEATDRETIGAITDPEARFHYNVLENSIIRSIARHRELPGGAMIEAWRFLQQRSDLRLLDIGSGTGHWVDFFREVYFVSEATCVEITDAMGGFLRAKYAADEGITVMQCDIAGEDFDPNQLGEPFDYISAIGVMFHIVDDVKWRRALSVLADRLKPNGLLFIGGAFGTKTENVQFHKIDEFNNWREHSAANVDTAVRVNKRVRSLADWQGATQSSGLFIRELIRSDSERDLMTPENDILVLQRG